MGTVPNSVGDCPRWRAERGICYNVLMDNLKQIMYGVTDFALMRAENAYFEEECE